MFVFHFKCSLGVRFCSTPYHLHSISVMSRAPCICHTVGLVEKIHGNPITTSSSISSEMAKKKKKKKSYLAGFLVVYMYEYYIIL